MFVPRKESLNPCCSGRWSRTVEFGSLQNGVLSLNPYCSGQWSRTYIIKLNAIVLAVLILVVMEDGLILNAIDRKRGILPRVLILVVMDNGLVLY